MRLLATGILFCAMASGAVLVDDQISDLVRRIDLLNSRESPAPRAATLDHAAALLKTVLPETSARFAGQARHLPHSSSVGTADRTPLDRAVATGDAAAIERAAGVFLHAVEQGAENPADYDWFATLRREHGFAAGSDNPSVRVRDALADLALLLRTDLDFQLSDLAGRPVALKAQRGKTVVLVFWATWCGPCQQEMPMLEKLWREKQGDGFTVFAITDEPADEVREFVAQRGYAVPVLRDPDRRTFRLYDIRTMPAAIVIDATGRVRARFDRTTEAELRAFVEKVSYALLNEK